MNTHVGDHQPCGVPSEIDEGSYTSVLDVLNEACKKYYDKPAFSNMGHTISYGELNELSSRFAHWVTRETELVSGDRIAIQLPNVL